MGFGDKRKGVGRWEEDRKGEATAAWGDDTGRKNVRKENKEVDKQG